MREVVMPVKNMVVLCTVDDEDVARRIARELIEKKLVACVQMAKISSVYTWEGKMEEGDELLCLIKTREDKYDLLEEEIRRMHPYEVPEIIAVPIERGSPDYFAWLNSWLGP